MVQTATALVIKTFSSGALQRGILLMRHEPTIDDVRLLAE